MNTDLSSSARTLNLILFVLVIMALYFAKDVILPLIMGALLALTLSPLVRSMARRGIAPPISATAIIMLLAGLLAAAALLLSGPITNWINDAPQLGAELQRKLQSLMVSLELVQQASNKVDGLTATAADPAVQRVSLEQPGLLTMAVSNVASILATTVVTLVLALFLLSSGDMFYYKLIDAFPTFGDKKRALRIVYGIERSVSRYLSVVSVINLVLAVVIGAVMWAIGMPQPFGWAVLAFFVNFLPYIGPLLGAGLAGAVGIVTFDSLGHAALAPILYLTATSIEGQFVTPVILGRQLELNTVSVFVMLVFWGWLWGIAGALMAVPFLVCLKVMCDNVPSLNTLGSFLSAEAVSIPAVVTTK